MAEETTDTRPAALVVKGARLRDSNPVLTQPNGVAEKEADGNSEGVGLAVELGAGEAVVVCVETTQTGCAAGAVP